MTGEQAVVALLLAVIVVLAIALAVVISRDGRGHRPPPSSRRRWDVGTTVEVRR